MLDAVQEARPSSSVDFAINTHHHGDHTFGNSLLPASTCVIGHERMRVGFLEDRTLENFPAFWSPVPDFGVLTRRPPNLTITSSATIHLAERRVDILHPGYTAHTEGDVVVWVPDTRVLFAGDLLFPGHTPMIMAGTPSGAIKSLAWMGSFEPEVVVPGHGEVIFGAALADVLAEHEEYYRFVLREARRGIEQRLTPLEVAFSTDLSSFAHLLDPERFVLNVHSAYAELGGPSVHRHGALADVVEWTGGPIPTQA